MITIISGTNRPNSKTKIIADYCYRFVLDSGLKCQMIDLVDLNVPLLSSEMYSESGQHEYISEIQEKFLIDSDHWLIVSPEYNGSFPGILKLFLDAVSVRRLKETFSDKKITLIGIASGRAGNFRGMEHLTGILNYLKMIVMPNKLPISSVNKVISKEGIIEKEASAELNEFLQEMLAFNSYGRN